MKTERAPAPHFALAGNSDASGILILSHMNFTYRRLSLELKYTWNTSRAHFEKDFVYILRIEKDGIMGLGECSVVQRYGETEAAMARALASAGRILAKADPWEFAQVEQQLRRLFPGLASLRAGIDTALLDWRTKALGIPLYALWGLSPEIRVPSSFTIGIAAPEVIQKKIREVPDDPILKIKLGVQQDREIMLAARETTDRVIRVDANEGWGDFQTALQRVQWLATQNVDLIEQPLPAGRFDEVRRLREASPLPIIADEDCHTVRDIPRLAGVYDGINIKLAKAGSLQECYRMIEVAGCFGLRVMLGCMLETSIGVTAMAHLAPLADIIDLDAHRLLRHDPFCGLQVDCGMLTLPDGPGLGVTPAI